MKARLADDITPVTDFRTNAAELLKRVKTTKRPLILTQRGRSAAILEDVKEYELRLDRLELLEAIVRGLHAAEQGDTVSHDEAMRQLDHFVNG